MTTITTTTQSLPVQNFAASAAFQAAAAGMTPADIIKILRRRIVMILAVWLTVIGLAVGGTVLWARFWPSYIAIGFVKVTSPNMPDPMALTVETYNQDLTDRYIRDEIENIRSLNNITVALSDPLLRETDWYQGFERRAESPEEAILELVDRLGVSQIYGSSLIRVSFPTRRLEDTAKVVNAVLASYDATNRQKTRSEISEQRANLGLQLDSLMRERTTKRNELLQFQKSENIPGMTARLNDVTIRLQQATYAAAQAQEEKLEWKGLYDSYTQEDAPSPQVFTEVENLPQIDRKSVV